MANLIELPCGCTVAPGEHFGAHLSADRAVTCSIHNRKFLVHSETEIVTTFTVTKELT